MQLFLVPEDVEQTYGGAAKLGKYGGDGNACNSHVKADYENKIQCDIDDGSGYHGSKRRPGIAYASKDHGAAVVNGTENRKAQADAHIG